MLARRVRDGAPSQAPRGRGAADNPANRFEKRRVELDPEALAAADRVSPDGECGPADCDSACASAPPNPATARARGVLLPDKTREILAENESPDVGFRYSVNPYRGCEHGCIYCFARPTHEYLGYSAGLDFETKILVKYDAPELLERALRAARWQPQPIALSGVTDPFQPIERRLRIARRCLEVLARFRNPVVIITKSNLVTRDIDILGEMARWQGAVVNVSLTSLDESLASVMEPRAARPAARLAAIEALSQAGIPVKAMLAPIIPGLTDHEVPALVAAAARAGARAVDWIPLRMPWGIKELFEEWLERHFPDRRQRVLNRMRELHGGKLYDSRYFHRQRGEGVLSEHLDKLFEVARRRAGLELKLPPLSAEHFRHPAGEQLELFG